MARSLFSTLLLAACAAASFGASAQGFSIQGSFSGIADAETLPLGTPPPRPESYYDGALVTGTFELLAPAVEPYIVGADYAYFLNPGGLFSLNYTIRDESFSYVVGGDGGTGGVILLQPGQGGSTTQTVTFLTNFIWKYGGASFSLSGPSGSLFDGVDGTTLHSPTSPPLFSTHFDNASAGMYVNVDVTDVQFGGVSPVPEPASVGMFAAGLALLLGWTSRTRRPRERCTRSG